MEKEKSLTKTNYLNKFHNCNPRLNQDEIPADLDENKICIQPKLI